MDRIQDKNASLQEVREGRVSEDREEICLRGPSDPAWFVQTQNTRCHCFCFTSGITRTRLLSKTHPETSAQCPANSECGNTLVSIRTLNLLWSSDTCTNIALRGGPKRKTNIHSQGACLPVGRRVPPLVRKGTGSVPVRGGNQRGIWWGEDVAPGARAVGRPRPRNVGEMRAACASRGYAPAGLPGLPTPPACHPLTSLHVAQISPPKWSCTSFLSFLPAKYRL